MECFPIYNCYGMLIGKCGTGIMKNQRNIEIAFYGTSIIIRFWFLYLSFSFVYMQINSKGGLVFRSHGQDIHIVSLLIYFRKKNLWSQGYLQEINHLRKNCQEGYRKLTRLVSLMRRDKSLLGRKICLAKLCSSERFHLIDENT